MDARRQTARRTRRFETLELQLERTAIRIADWVLELDPVKRIIAVIGGVSALVLGWIASKLG